MDFSIDPESDSTEYPAFRRMLETLMHDQNAVGWDQPARVYQVTGTIDDPALELLTEQMLHPIGILDAAYHQGLTIDDDSIGIAVSIESWAAVSFDEMRKVTPQMVDDIAEKARANGLSDEAVEEAARTAWQKFLEIIPFESLPDDLREEVRTLIVVLKDGTIMLSSHARGREKISFSVPDPGFDVGWVPESMKLFLNGEHPIPGSHDEPLVQGGIFIMGSTDDNNPFA
jgi:hypothetical protein